MSNEFRKGFRQEPAPTKGRVLEENNGLKARLDNLESQLRMVGNFLNNMMQQMMKVGPELNALSTITAASLADAEYTAELGDIVMVDYFGKLLNEDGSETPFPGGYGENYAILGLGSGSLIPGFEEQIKGRKSGEVFNLDVTFPENYGTKELSGKKSRFLVQIHKIYKQIEVQNSPVRKAKMEHDLEERNKKSDKKEDSSSADSQKE